jgi:hypothetical protein
MASAPVSKNQALAFPNVVAPANPHNIHCLGAIDRFCIVLAANPVGHADIAAMVEQLDEICWNGFPRAESLPDENHVAELRQSIRICPYLRRSSPRIC